MVLRNRTSRRSTLWGLVAPFAGRHVDPGESEARYRNG
jgi:hypothetical protein